MHFQLRCAFETEPIILKFKPLPEPSEENSPMNTSTVPTHCMELMGLAKRITDAKMVKNLRVVVMMEQVRGPKYTTVMKIKLWREKHRDKVRPRTGI